MSSRNAAHLPITEHDVASNYDRANHLLTKASWRPRTAPSEKSGADGGRWRPSTSYETDTGERSVSLITLSKHVSKDALLLTEPVNHTLTVLRRGIALGLHLARAYGQAAGLEQLVQQNRLGRLTQAQQGEFYEKHHTSSAVGVFACAVFVQWSLQQYEDEAVSGINMEFPGIPEIDLSNPLKSMECSIFYFGWMAENSGLVNTDFSFVKLALLYFSALADTIRSRAASLKHAESFTDVGYQLQGTEFVIEGFEDLASASVVTVEFNRVRFDQIVGNRAAKHEAKRIAQRLVCYDATRGSNPFMELGGMPLVRMGYGKPGTGKSLQIAATATLLHDYCERLAIPFLFWPLPDNLISTFQGGSAERAVAWIRRIQDPDKIIYAPIDDAENNFEDRTRQGVSAGVREVVGVFLRYTEGAYAIRRGNAVLEFFTNLPEQIDKAVLSRVQSRFPIDGAETREDFLDQDYLWWRKLEEIRQGFVGMRDPEDYRYLEAQRALLQLGEIESETDACDAPSDPRLKERFERAREEHSLDEHDFFARLFRETQAVYPLFSSRDLRNIQQQVSNRIMDFELPDDWFENLEVFFGKPFETRVEMLRELMKANMGGLSFAEIRLRETIRYLNSLAEIANADREREISRMAAQMEMRKAASERVEV